MSRPARSKTKPRDDLTLDKPKCPNYSELQDDGQRNTMVDTATSQGRKETLLTK